MSDDSRAMDRIIRIAKSKRKKSKKWQKYSTDSIESECVKCAKIIKEAQVEFEKSARQMLEWVRVQGEALNKVCFLKGPGGIRRWIEENTNYSRKTAYNYMNVSHHWDEVKEMPSLSAIYKYLIDKKKMEKECRNPQSADRIFQDKDEPSEIDYYSMDKDRIKKSVYAEINSLNASLIHVISGDEVLYKLTDRIQNFVQKYKRIAPIIAAYDHRALAIKYDIRQYEKDGAENNEDEDRQNKIELLKQVSDFNGVTVAERNLLRERLGQIASLKKKLKLSHVQHRILIGGLFRERFEGLEHELCEHDLIHS